MDAKANADRLLTAATLAAAERPVEATLLAWAALVIDATQAVRIAVVESSGRPPSDFFAVLEQAMPGTMPASEPGETAENWLLRCRDGLVALLPDSVRNEVSGELVTTVDLQGIDAPTPEVLAANAMDRTGGLTPSRFAETKRLEALERMEVAQALRVQADVGGAIREAYASDLASAEAYLMESASATGDALMVTVVARWALISDAIAQMAGLPADFTTAVASVRAAILGALDEADAHRLRDQLAPV